MMAHRANGHGISCSACKKFPTPLLVDTRGLLGGGEDDGLRNEFGGVFTRCEVGNPRRRRHASLPLCVCLFLIGISVKYGMDVDFLLRAKLRLSVFI